MNPHVEYDPEANALYLEFSDAPIVETVALSDSVYIDVDANGQPVGLEILFVTPQTLAGLRSLGKDATLTDLLRSAA